MSKLDREELILTLAVAFKDLATAPKEKELFGRAQKQLEDLINNQPEIVFRDIVKFHRKLMTLDYEDISDFPAMEAEEVSYIKGWLESIGVKIKE